jgi:pimeloyl-ACP methyl ester carboxylesterase
MYGTHTGAAIALEFGRRHPARVSGLLLDGVPIFTPAEIAALFEGYFQPLTIDARGGHYASTWTRFRDQYIWFPWTAKDPARLNETNLGAPEQIHLWVSMFFQCAAHYKSAYRAAVTYGENAIAAARELTVPALFSAHETDMLYPHLDRLPPLRAGQSVLRMKQAEAFEPQALAWLARLPPSGEPPDNRAPPSRASITRQFRDLPHGQILVRQAGSGGPPLLLLHDAPGTGENLDPALTALASRFTVIAPDLPGCGDSAPLPETATLDDFADVLALVLPTGQRTIICGIGFGASTALALAARHPSAVERLLLNGVLMPSAADRADLRSNLAPSITIAADGSHWYRTWLMLRDSLVYWPWYRPTVAALKRTPADFSGERLHRWTVGVMKQHRTYGRVMMAALSEDTAARLSDIGAPIDILEDEAHSLGVYTRDLRRLLPRAPVVPVNAGIEGLAGAIAAAVGP